MKALVTGAGGQDGTILRRLLRSHNVDVLGIGSRHPPAKQEAGEIRIVDVTDEPAVAHILSDFRPDQIYHLAACHHSSDQRGGVVLNRQMLATNFRSAQFLVTTVAERLPYCRLLLAGSSQMYTAASGARVVVSETTPMNPSSCYGWTKAWSRNLMSFYREYRNVVGCTTILFNHESPLRSRAFLTRKISMAAAGAKCGTPHALHLRDIAAETDWSSASDVVEGMQLALSAPTPEDYVLASGTAHRVQDILEIAFRHVGMDWRDFTTFDPPSDPPRGTLVGDSSRIRQSLGWTPRRGFARTIEQMVEFDLWLLGRGQPVETAGHPTE